MNVAESVAGLKVLIDTCSDSRHVAGEIHRSLAALRACYQSQRSDFSVEDVAFLSRAARIESSLLDFDDLLEERERTRCTEDADYCIVQFSELSETFHDTLMAKRAAKEVRELIEMRRSLPSMATNCETAELARTETRIKATAPACSRCKSVMQLRPGGGNYFWGCRQFPRCLNRAFLTSEQRAILKAARQRSS